MSDRILPTLGSVGTYEVMAPYDAKILPEEIYTCKAIRTISEYISYNQDVSKTVYEYYGLTTEDYEDDVKEDMEIVSLQNGDGIWIYIPAKYILKYPIANGIPYRQAAIVCKLPAIETKKDISHLKTDIGNLITDYLGVTAVIDIVDTSRVIAVTKDLSDQMTINRANASSGRITDRSRYIDLTIQHNEALTKIAELEQYIIDNL